MIKGLTVKIRRIISALIVLAAAGGVFSGFNSADAVEEIMLSV